MQHVSAEAADADADLDILLDSDAAVGFNKSIVVHKVLSVLNAAVALSRSLAGPGISWSGALGSSVVAFKRLMRLVKPVISFRSRLSAACIDVSEAGITALPWLGGVDSSDSVAEPFADPLIR